MAKAGRQCKRRSCQWARTSALGAPIEFRAVRQDGSNKTSTIESTRRSASDSRKTKQQKQPRNFTENWNGIARNRLQETFQTSVIPTDRNSFYPEQSEGSGPRR